MMSYGISPDSPGSIRISPDAAADIGIRSSDTIQNSRFGISWSNRSRNSSPRSKYPRAKSSTTLAIPRFRTANWISISLVASSNSGRSLTPSLSRKPST